MRRILFLLVVGAFVVLAGCGADDSQDDRQDGTAEDAADLRSTGETADLSFTADTVDGESFEGSSIAGQPAVLWFWAPWCATCVAEAPHVIDIAEQGDVTVVGVAGQGDVDEMHDFIDLTDTADLVHIADTEGEVWQHFEVNAQSTYVLLDSDGEISFRGFLPGDELAERVEALAG